MSDDQNDEQDSPSQLRKLYEAEAQARAEADRQLAELKARDVFRDAGLDLTNKQHAAFVKAYDGELDPAAVQSYVADLGITAQAPTPEAQGATPEEQQAQQRIADAARDDGGPPPKTPDLRDQLQRQINELPRNAPPDQVNKLFEAFSKAGGFPIKSDM